MTTEEESNNPKQLKQVKRIREGGYPFNNRPKGEMKLIAQKGGQVTGINKSEGQRWRHIKERFKRATTTTKDADWLLAKLEDRSSMAAEVMMTLDQLKRDGVHPSQRVALLNTETAILKTVHGEKIHIDSTNVNINIDMTDHIMEAYKRRMLKNQSIEVKDDDKV